MDEFLKRRGADRRLARLTHDVRLPLAKGLEIGAANNPVCLPEGFDVQYVDYDRNAAMQSDGCVTVDHVWNGSGSLADVCGRTDFYDFVIAAQVAQYVPNLLGWFNGVYKVLCPGGVFNISLPDRRFMFDINRNTSTIGEAVEAYHLDYGRPSIRQLFNHTFEALSVNTEQLWKEDVHLSSHKRLVGDKALEFASAQCLETIASGQYVTCHCWVFTPLSFLDLLEAATRIGLFPFVINQLSSTNVGDLEFFVSFRRDLEIQKDLLRPIQLSALSFLRNNLEGQMRRARLLAGK